MDRTDKGSTVRRNALSRWWRGRARHGLISLFMWLGMLVVLVLMAARMVPSSRSAGRVIPELVAFVPFAVLPTLVVVLLSILWHRRILAVLSALCLATLVVWHVGYFVPRHTLSDTARSATSTSSGTAPNTDDRVLRLMTLNTLNGRVSASKVVDVVRTQKVELLALQEVSQGFLQELSDAGIHDLLPYSVLGSSGRSDNGGINVLFSATQMSDQNTSLLPIETSAMPAGSLSIGGTTVRFVSAHPNSPHKGGQGLWSEGLTTIAKLANYSHSYVILGDFNATWDHARFRELLGSSFVDAGEQAGEGFHMTYPANSTIPPLIEIDHIVYSRDAGLYVGDLQTISVAGSDHLALLATLEAS